MGQNPRRSLFFERIYQTITLQIQESVTINQGVCGESSMIADRALV
jgi:hypothetical protein